MFDDIDDVAEGEDVVVGDGVFVGVEGDEIVVEVVAAGELGFVVGFERGDEEFAVADGDGAGVLGGDGEAFVDLAGVDVDDGDLVFGGEGDVGFFVAGEGDADGFVEGGGFGGGVECLDGGDDVEVGGFRRSEVDDADRVGDVVGDPEFGAVGADGEGDGVDADVDAVDDLSGSGVDDVDGIGGGVDDEDVVAVYGDGVGVGAEEGGVADFCGSGCCGRHGVAWGEPEGGEGGAEESGGKDGGEAGFGHGGAEVRFPKERRPAVNPDWWGSFLWSGSGRRDAGGPGGGEGANR